MRTIRLTEETKKNLLNDLLKRSPNNYDEYADTVNEIVNNVKVNGDAALFEYTKKLSEQIAYYDAIARGEFSNPHTTNPFTQPINITIIWIDDKDE